MASHKPKTKAGKQAKAAKVMKEFHKGSLHHGKSGKLVPKSRPDIAKAIAMRSAGLSKRKSKV